MNSENPRARKSLPPANPDPDQEMTSLARGIINTQFRKLTSVHPTTREHVVRENEVANCARKIYGTDRERLDRLTVRLGTMLREEVRKLPKAELAPFFNAGRS